MEEGYYCTIHTCFDMGVCVFEVKVRKMVVYINLEKSNTSLKYVKTHFRITGTKTNLNFKTGLLSLLHHEFPKSMWHQHSLLL